jgi:predicted aldo/keto reductase-like oxidoreductase
MKKLGFGFMRLPLVDSSDRRNSPVDIELIQKMVDRFMENGFNYFDTAYKYGGGKSEPALRKALVDRYPRNSYILTTKLSNEFMQTKEEQQQVFDDQMRILGCGYFDYYLLHNQGAYNLRKSEKLDSFRFLQDKKKKGLVKNIGMSWHDSAELLDKTLTEHPELDIVQIQLNYLDWENDSIQSQKCYEVARKHGKPVLVMEPVKGGTLMNIPEEAEKLFRSYSPNASNASWAIRFAASHEGVMAVLSGMNSMEQMEDNINFMKDFVPMNNEELEITAKAAEIIRTSAMIPCTGCRYCTVVCPKNIPIPDYFSLMQQGHTTTQIVYYLNLAQRNGRASDCIECHQCEKHCPQHIKIPELLKEVSKAYDGFKGW